jgi:FG-GAP-like repeat
MRKSLFLFVCLYAIAQTQGVVGILEGRAQDPAGQATYGATAGPQNPQTGSATAGVFAPVLDSEKRPITAGGFVKTGPIVFQEIAEKAGLTTWRHTMGTPEKNYIIEATGSGVALLDYDNDGWLDIYMVNGSTFDAISGKTEPPHAALFHNNHDGTFTNVAEKAGVTNDRWGFGRTSMYRTTGRIASITTITTGRLRMWRKRQASRWETGPQEPLLATTTVTGGWISLSPDTFTGT